MARNGSGVYSLPPGSTVASGDVSDPSDINTPLADIATDLNTARPIVAGGTGATTASAARTNLGIGGMATQTADAVAITGGAIDGTAIGGTTPAAGAFTTVSATGAVSVSTIQQTGDADNAVSFSTDEQSFTTSGSERISLNDSGVQFGATGARITSFATTVTDSDTIGVTGGAVVGYVVPYVTSYVDAEIAAISTGAWEFVSTQTPSGGSVTTTGLSGYRSVRFNLTVQEDGGSAVYTLQARTSAGTWRTLGIVTASVSSNTVMTFAGEITNFNNADSNGRKGYVIWSGGGTGTIDVTDNEVVSNAGETRVGTSFRSEVWDEIRITTNGSMEGSGSFSVDGMAA